ncbi:MAG: hypothetical protein S4CHLAM81_00030 [Chlamydiales bacterium]|nr:hypothetical protein [Chlamydiales bacterium]MCH9634807.1 hypothetical protein [Chlamydiales bacterium]MCH9704132.1 DUF502 domain-containing protein [Chlamydiota bacterium]
MKWFKQSFLTGLVILLPIALTILVIAFIVNFLTKPFVGAIEHFFVGNGFYEDHQSLVRFILQLVSLGLLFTFTVLLGFLARVVFFRWLISIYDYIFHRIPVIKTIYKATQQIIRTIFGSSSKSFKQVVMVPFPTHGAYCIGLVSGSAPPNCDATVGSKLISVFVPTTPNPTSGYLIMYREEEVIHLEMKVEEAIKYIISCGVINKETPLDDLLA